MHSQSLCIVVLAVTLLKPAESALSNEQMEETLLPIRNKCLEQTGAAVASVDVLKKNIFAEDRPTKCYIECIHKNLGTMNKEGNMDLDVILKQMEALMPPEMSEKMMTVARKCVNLVKSEDTCDKAYEFTKCTSDEAPEHFYFP